MQLRLHHVALTPVWQLLIFRLPAVKSAPRPTSCKVLLMDAMKPNSISVKLSTFHDERRQSRGPRLLQPSSSASIVLDA